MKITDILNNGKINISCELFPPKTDDKFAEAKTVVREIAALSPSYMSVTYGAAGTASGKTLEIADEIQNGCKVTALAHLTCVASNKDKIKDVLNSLKEKNIENILALRGDLPQDSDFPLSENYKHASDLMREITDFGGFCIGGACYPEGHPESNTIFDDIENLKIKQDSGCSFLTTQMFFDNNILYNYMYKLLKAGVTIPVIAGIMPVTNAAQIKRIISLSGSLIPSRFKAIVDRFADSPEAMKQAGIAYATEQIIDLAANGVNNIHIYTMNKPDVAGSIMKNLSEIIGG